MNKYGGITIDEAIEAVTKLSDIMNQCYNNQEKCKILNCEYNTDGNCLCCDDLHNPDKLNECVSFLDQDEM